MNKATANNITKPNIEGRKRGFSQKPESEDAGVLVVSETINPKLNSF